MFKTSLFQVLCHGLFKRPDIQEIADIVRFENDMVRAEAVCDTLAKPMSDVEKQHLRRVFHRAFGVHPRGKYGKMAGNCSVDLKQNCQIYTSACVACCRRIFCR